MTNNAQEVILCVLEKIKYKADIAPEIHQKEMGLRGAIRNIEYPFGKPIQGKIIALDQQDVANCNINFGDELNGVLGKLKEDEVITDFRFINDYVSSGLSSYCEVALPKNFDERFREIKNRLEINLPTDLGVIKEYLHILNQIEREKQKTLEGEWIKHHINQDMTGGVPNGEGWTNILRILNQGEIIKLEDDNLSGGEYRKHLKTTKQIQKYKETLEKKLKKHREELEKKLKLDKPEKTKALPKGKFKKWFLTPFKWILKTFIEAVVRVGFDQTKK